MGDCCSSIPPINSENINLSIVNNKPQNPPILMEEDQMSIIQNKILKKKPSTNSQDDKITKKNDMDRGTQKLTKHTYKGDDLLKNSRINDISQIPEFNEKDVYKLEILGKGGFGTVQNAYHIKESSFVALKTFETTDPDSIQDIISEDNLLTAVERVNEEIRISNNISPFLKYYGVFTIKQGVEVSLVLQMESGVCTLDDILEVGKSYSCNEIFYVLKQLVKSFALLQQKGLVNRDVKAQNIILVESNDNDGSYLYKISDFGEGYEIQPGVNEIDCDTLAGTTPTYRAPEIYDIIKETYDYPTYNPFKSDVFSLGITVLKMINHNWGKKSVSNGLLDQDGEFKDYKPIQKILKKMLDKNPINRLDFFGLLSILEKEENCNQQKPLQEFEYYIASLDKKEKKIIDKGFQNILALYGEHYKLSDEYFKKASRNKQAIFHIERAWKLLQGDIKKHLEITGAFQNYKEKKGEIKKEEELVINSEMDFHSEEINCLYLLGWIEIKKGTFSKAKEYFDKALNIWMNFENKRKNALTSSWSNQESKIYNNLAAYYQEMNNLPKSEELYQKSLKLRLSIFGENHSLTAASYNNLAIIYEKMGNLPQAEIFHQRALEIKLGLFGENHFDMAASYNNLANLYQIMDKLPKAEELYNRSLKIRQTLFGEIHSLTANSYNNLASVYQKMGNNIRAEEFYQRSLKIRLALFGENHCGTADSFFNFSLFYAKIGKIHSAKDFAFRAHTAFVSLYGENHSKTQLSLKNLNRFKE